MSPLPRILIENEVNGPGCIVHRAQAGDDRLGIATAAGSATEQASPEKKGSQGFQQGRLIWVQARQL